MRRLIVSIVLTGVLAAAGCAKHPPPSVAPSAPRYPDFVFAPPASSSPGDLAKARQAWDALQAGNLSGAERQLTELLRRSPGNPSIVTSLGYVALARREYDHALARFGDALSSAPGSTPALVGRGLAFAEAGRPRDALVSFEAAQMADPALGLEPRIEALRFRAVEDAVAKARAAAGAGHLDQAQAAYAEALDESPDSPLLLRELAAVERRGGRLAAAHGHLERAATVDPADRQTRLDLADLAEAQGQLEDAIRYCEAAQSIEQTPEIDARLTSLRERAELARLPGEYREIPAAPVVTRAELAALVGVRLSGVLRAAPSRPVPLVTDVAGTWASPWIEAVLRAGVMEPFSNHTFQPGASLHRGDLAVIVSRLLSLAAVLDPPRAGRWQRERATLTDIPPSHPAYDAASRAVGAKVIDADRGGSFDPARLVTGAEAVDAVTRLERLAGPRARPDRR